MPDYDHAFKIKVKTTFPETGTYIKDFPDLDRELNLMCLSYKLCRTFKAIKIYRLRVEPAKIHLTGYRHQLRLVIRISRAFRACIVNWMYDSVVVTATAI